MDNEEITSELNEIERKIYEKLCEIREIYKAEYDKLGEDKPEMYLTMSIREDTMSANNNYWEDGVPEINFFELEEEQSHLDGNYQSKAYVLNAMHGKRNCK